jgi:hypothetical protein
MVIEMAQGLAIVVEAQDLDFDLVLVLASFIACLNATQCQL